MVRKQNHLQATFYQAAEHSLRKDAMLYSEQMSSARTITSGWIAGLPKSGQQQSSRSATSLAKFKRRVLLDAGLSSPRRCQPP